MPARKKVAKARPKKVTKPAAVKKPAPELPAKEVVAEIVEQVMLASPVPEVTEHSDEERKQEAAARQAAHEAEVKRLTALGLVEVPVRGSPYTLVGLADPKAEPLLEQRVEIAKRLNAVGPLLPRFVKHVVVEPPAAKQTETTQPGGSTSMATKETAAEAAEGVKHAENLKELDKIEKAKAKRNETIVQTAKQFLAEKGVKSKKKKGSKQPDVRPKVSAKESKAAPAAAPKKKEKAKASKSMTPVKVPAGGFKKESVPATSGELIRARIAEHKLTDEEIASEVRKLFPGRNTKVSDVRWNRGQMRKHGIDAPDPVGEAPQPAKKGGKKK